MRTLHPKVSSLADIARKTFRRIAVSNLSASIYVASSVSAKRLLTPLSQAHGRKIGLEITMQRSLSVIVHMGLVLIYPHGWKNTVFVVGKSSIKVIRSSLSLAWLSWNSAETNNSITMFTQP